MHKQYANTIRVMAIRLINKAFHPAKMATGVVGQTVITHPVCYLLSLPFLNAYRGAKIWLERVILAQIDGQVIAIDQTVRENSRLHSCNFLNTPQTFYVLPGKVRKMDA
jgi:uncharacterized membrane protein